jgi:hypothetical protein
MRRQVTMALPGETEAGSAGTQPCRGIAWRAHRDDRGERGSRLSRSSQNPIGSKDPHALKIPARRAECSLTGNARIPFQAEPEQQYPHRNRSLPQRSSAAPLAAPTALLLPGVRHCQWIPRCASPPPAAEPRTKRASSSEPRTAAGIRQNFGQSERSPRGAANNGGGSRRSCTRSPPAPRPRCVPRFGPRTMRGHCCDSLYRRRGHVVMRAAIARSRSAQALLRSRLRMRLSR